MKWKSLIFSISYKLFYRTLLYLHVFLGKCIVGVRNSYWSLCLAHRILYIALLEDSDNFTDSDVRLVLSMLRGSSTGYTTLLKFLSQNWEELRQRYVRLNSIPSAVMRGGLSGPCIVTVWLIVCVLWMGHGFWKYHLLCSERLVNFIFIHSFIHSLFRSFIRSFVCLRIKSFIHSFVRSFIHSFFLSLIRLFIHSFVLSVIHSFVISFAH
jgi:hypothetical protein